MPTGYYLACFETYRYVWIGSLDDTSDPSTVNAQHVSAFCLEHRGKALIVVSEEHQVLEEGEEWTV
jgi:hypothetical protein